MKSGGTVLVIDLSTDEAKFITRYIGRAWRFGLSPGTLRQIERVFGSNIPRNLLLRRRTTDELIDYCLLKIKQFDINIQLNVEQLKYALGYQIGKKASGYINVNDNFSVELILTW